MAGSLNLFDSVQYTAASEYGSRQGEQIDTLQIHHATMTSLSGLIGLMQPGGRTVSANGALGTDGHLVEVVPLDKRPFTSATGYDRRSLTVEVCNTSLSPSWGISEECRLRLARLAVQMYRKGLLGSLTRNHIIGHYEVPGTYATACPGPDMNLDRIVAYARAMNSSTAGEELTPIEEAEVIAYHSEDRRVKSVEPGGNARLKDARGYDVNVTRSVGEYSITPHVYAEGAPGDVLELALIWMNNSDKRQSPHYVERLVIDKDGELKASREFKRAVREGDNVFVHVHAPESNTGPVEVTLMDCDAFAFKS